MNKEVVLWNNSIDLSLLQHELRNQYVVRIKTTIRFWNTPGECTLMCLVVCVNIVLKFFYLATHPTNYTEKPLNFKNRTVEFARYLQRH